MHARRPFSGIAKKGKKMEIKFTTLWRFWGLVTTAHKTNQALRFSLLKLSKHIKASRSITINFITFRAPTLNHSPLLARSPVLSANVLGRKWNTWKNLNWIFFEGCAGLCCFELSKWFNWISTRVTVLWLVSRGMMLKESRKSCDVNMIGLFNTYSSSRGKFWFTTPLKLKLLLL
jgi:hypothetical protein